MGASRVDDDAAFTNTAILGPFDTLFPIPVHSSFIPPLSRYRIRTGVALLPGPGLAFINRSHVKETRTGMVESRFRAHSRARKARVHGGARSRAEPPRPRSFLPRVLLLVALLWLVAALTWKLSELLRPMTQDTPPALEEEASGAPWVAAGAARQLGRIAGRAAGRVSERSKGESRKPR